MTEFTAIKLMMSDIASAPSGDFYFAKKRAGGLEDIDVDKNFFFSGHFGATESREEASGSSSDDGDPLWRFRHGVYIYKIGGKFTLDPSNEVFSWRSVHFLREAVAFRTDERETVSKKCVRRNEVLFWVGPMLAL